MQGARVTSANRPSGHEGATLALLRFQGRKADRARKQQGKQGGSRKRAAREGGMRKMLVNETASVHLDAGTGGIQECPILTLC